MNWLTWLSSIYFAPEDTGAETTEETAGEEAAEAEKPKPKPKAKAKSVENDPELANKVSAILHQKGVNPDDTTIDEVLAALISARDDEIQGRIKEREKRQIAEGKLGSALLEDILERRDIPADVRTTVKQLAAQADQVANINANLATLAEFGMFDPEMLDLAMAPPAELKRSLELAKKLTGAKPAKKAAPKAAEETEETAEEEGEEGEGEEAGASGLTQDQLRKLLGKGFAADMGKGQPNGQNGKVGKKSALEKYMPSLKSKDQQAIDAQRDAANKRAQVGQR
jgi:hypothetical protein